MDFREYYLDRLEKTRREFDEKFGVYIIGFEMVEELKQSRFFDNVKNLCIKPYDNHIKDMYELLKKEDQSEFEFRKKSVRDYINFQGLTKFKDEIIHCMNKTCKRITLWDDSFDGNLFQLRVILHHDSSALLKFGLDYVDKWKAIYELFK